MTTRRLLAAVLLAAACLLSPFGLASASAHEGEGEFTVEERQPVDGGFRYLVRLTWTNDGHAALDATVTATAVAPDGTAQTPVPMNPSDQDGRYAAVVSYPSPGAWTLRLTAVSPAATAEVAQQVPTTTTTTTTTTSTTVATTVAAPTKPPASTPTTDDPGSSSEDGAGSGALFVIVVVAALGLIAIPILWQRRRSRP